MTRLRAFVVFVATSAAACASGPVTIENRLPELESVSVGLYWGSKATSLPTPAPGETAQSEDSYYGSQQVTIVVSTNGKVVHLRTVDDIDAGSTLVLSEDLEVTPYIPASEFQKGVGDVIVNANR